LKRREIFRGVTQGPVLGPLLWNLAYDEVLGRVLRPGCHVICYADDTLVVAGGTNWKNAIVRRNIAVAGVVGGIKSLYLGVAPRKTEAIFFRDGSRGAPPRLPLTLDGHRVEVETRMKYVGLHLDGGWEFGEHFAQLAAKMGRIAASLSRLLANLGGPDGCVRKLYVGTVGSVALYGAPIWVGAASRSRRIRGFLRGAHRPIVLRAARAYRTVSYAAAALLAGGGVAHWRTVQLDTLQLHTVLLNT